MFEREFLRAQILACHILEWRAAWDATAPQHQQDFILFLVQHEKLGFFRIGQLHHKLLRWAPGCAVRSSSLNQNVLVVVADKLLGKKGTENGKETHVIMLTTLICHWRSDGGSPDIVKGRQTANHSPRFPGRNSVYF